MANKPEDLFRDRVTRGLTNLHRKGDKRLFTETSKPLVCYKDKERNSKIQDFGLGKLNEDDNTHSSSRDYNKEEAISMIQVVILCASPDHIDRSLMSDLRCRIVSTKKQRDFRT